MLISGLCKISKVFFICSKEECTCVNTVPKNVLPKPFPHAQYEKFHYDQIYRMRARLFPLAF